MNSIERIPPSATLSLPCFTGIGGVEDEPAVADRPPFPVGSKREVPNAMPTVHRHIVPCLATVLRHRDCPFLTNSNGSLSIRKRNTLQSIRRSAGFHLPRPAAILGVEQGGVRTDRPCDIRG